MFDTLSNKQMIDVISNCVIGRLGCHANDKTYVVPISYAYENDYIYARTFDGMKLEMMRKNPQVCFQVDRMQQMSDWESVIAWGTFEELTDADNRTKGLKILVSRILPNITSEMARLTPEWPFPTEDFNRIEGIVFRIHIREMTGRSEKLDSELYRR